MFYYVNIACYQEEEVECNSRKFLACAHKSGEGEVPHKMKKKRGREKEERNERERDITKKEIRKRKRSS